MQKNKSCIDNVLKVSNVKLVIMQTNDPCECYNHLTYFNIGRQTQSWKEKKKQKNKQETKMFPTQVFLTQPGT